MSTLMLLTLLLVSNGKWPSTKASASSGYVQLDVPMRNLTRYEGETVRIRCEITGFPLPGYRWYHDDQLIRPDPQPPPTPSSAISSAQLAASNPSTAGADGPRRDSKTTPWGSRLKIDDLTVKDSGYYMCEGFNVYGHQKTVGYLQVLPGPNPNPPHRPSNPDQSRPGESDIDDIPGADGGGLGSYYEGGAGDDAGYTDSQEGGGRDGRPRDVDDDGWQRPATATGSGQAAPGSGGGGGMDSSKRALSMPENFATTISLSSSCQEYRGLVCSSILSRKYVNIPTPSYQAEREEKLIATFTTIATSNDFNPQCGETAMSLLCHYAFKPCGENNGDVFGQGHRVQVCKDFCETLQKDTCRSAQNLVRQHLQREYQLAPPRCDARSEMCDFGDPFDFQSTTDVHVRSTTDSSSMTAYIVAACVGAALAVVIIFLVARRCRPRYRPVTNRKQPTSAATSAVASSTSNKFAASKPIVSVTAAKQANLSSQHLQFSGNKMADYGYQVRQQQLMQEQCVMLLPGATSTLQRPGGHAGLMPTAAFSGVGSLPVVASIAEVHPSNVRLVQRIGEGSFGTVYVGEVAASLIGQLSTVTSSMRPVIVKTLSNSGLTGIDYSYFRTYFIERALSTAVLHHPNLLSVVGGCIQSVSSSGTISLLFEHYGGIDLDSFVRGRFGTTSGLTVFRLAEGISAGMEYATSRGWVHGDLTVHNVLVIGCGIADGFSTFQQVKVTDLGMTSSWSTTVGQPALQSGAAEHHHRSSSFPVSRQTAPEVAVYGHLAAGEASDVWSFGVLLWEIYSMRTAAEAVSDSTGSGNGDVDVISGNGAATSDRDMLFVCPGTLPIRCPTSMATLMSDCWNEVPDQRPTFATVHGMLINIMERLDSQHQFGVSTDVSSPLTATTGNSSSSPATSNETACTMLTDAHHRQQLLAAEAESDLHRHSTSVDGQQATPLLQSYRHFQRRPWPAMGSDLVQTGGSSDHELMHQVATQYPAFRGGYWSGSDNNSATHGGGGGSSLGPSGLYDFGGRPCPTPATTIDRSPSYICRLHENFSNVV